MNIWIAMGVLALVITTGFVTPVSPQDKPTKTTLKSTRTLTGCLQNGDSPDEFQLTTSKGSTWEVKSDTVKLAEHVGHTVTVTGKVSHPTAHGMKEDAKEEAKEHGLTKTATEHGHLTVTDLKMVSKSCKK
jgi:hypothetical protein